MNTKDFLKSYNGIRWENHIGRISIAVLSVLVLFLSYTSVNVKERIVLQPFTLKGDAWIEYDNGSQNYKEAWASALAILMGNITPDNLDFIKERLKPLLGENIRNETLTAFEQQAEDIRKNRVTFSFEMKRVDYESKTNKVFVFGYSYAKGSLAKEKRPERKPRTYEYIIEVDAYLPKVTHIDTYEGKPRDLAALARIEDQKERQEAKN